MSALTAVRACIAEAVLHDAGHVRPAPHDGTLGTITLRPAQRSTLRHVECAVAEFGGALLADEPGLGKTFVALAFARSRGEPLVIAPAALRAMWRDAAARADTPIAFVSLERLSRAEVAVRRRVVIVDEAHHAANRAAARYPRLARLCAGADVLLLSATPVRNRRAELDALLGLIVGPRAARLDRDELARIVVRRSAAPGDRPAIAATRWHRVRCRVDVREQIAELPAPIPAADGAEARALVASGLARCWASSLAALDAALRRRVQRGAAMLDALDRGARPTRAELRHWVLGDDATQLAFPEFVAARDLGADALAGAMRAHIEAVRRLRAQIAPNVDDDTSVRAALLHRLCARHRGTQVVAFTSFSATAEALWRALRHASGVALLTGHSARTASGPRPRADILRALDGAHESAPHDRVSLVIATDVLSEGVNLQGASVIVHLDQPWTPAALDQRAGRAARIGTRHEVVHVHAVRAPRGAVALLRHDTLMARKRRDQRAATSAATATERLRALVAPWQPHGIDPHGEAPIVAAVDATRAGWLAVLDDGHRAWLTSHRGAAPRTLLRLVRAARGDERPCAPRASAGAVAAVLRSIERENARALSPTEASPARRALLRRLDALVACSRAAERAAMAQAATRVRTALAAANGAGAELEIGAIACEPTDRSLAWLERTEQRLRALARPDDTRNDEGAGIRPRLIALLILQPARRARRVVNSAWAPRSPQPNPNAPTAASP